VLHFGGFRAAEVSHPTGIDFGIGLLASGADGMVDPSDFELPKLSL
jgi:hypothetical protein